MLGERLGVPVFHEPGVQPPELAKQGYAAAREQKCDVVIIDTAGRLAIDEQLMEELEAIKAHVQPDNILLVFDAMIGQDAVRTAAEFNRRLGIDGFVLTKLDGDARGGAALSIKEVTGEPIKFLGMGEALDKLEEFRPDGLASRILGFGDIVGLMKDFEEVVDEKKAEEDAQEAPLRQLHAEGLRRADPHGPEDGAAQGPAREVPPLRRADRAAQPRRQGAARRSRRCTTR